MYVLKQKHWKRVKIYNSIETYKLFYVLSQTDSFNLGILCTIMNVKEKLLEVPAEILIICTFFYKTQQYSTKFSSIQGTSAKLLYWVISIQIDRYFFHSLTVHFFIKNLILFSFYYFITSLILLYSVIDKKKLFFVIVTFLERDVF